MKEENSKKMIELYEFLLLDRDKKAYYLWENGTFLINTKEEKCSYNLYSLNGYYVEVIYSNANNSIDDIRPFRKGELLNKYLDIIKLSYGNTPSI